MKVLHRLLTCFSTCAILCSLGAGCGSETASSTGQAPKIGPHGALAIALPGDTGFVEVVTEFPATKGAKKPTVVAYFFESDLKSPLKAAPTGVSVSIPLIGQSTPTSVPLSPEPKAKEASGGLRFASKPVDADSDGLSGELSATVGAGTLKAPFSLGR